jgi:mRNA interferase MazF
LDGQEDPNAQSNPHGANAADIARRRPVLVLSHDVFKERSGTVITIALMSQPQRAGFPLTLELQPKGFAKKSWVKISQIPTLVMGRIGQ